MRRLSPGDHRSSESLIHRLDRAADGINPLLVILMIGLLILNLTHVATMGLSSLSITRVDPSCLISPASATGGIGAVKPPG
jgi:hypothetical protein